MIEIVKMAGIPAVVCINKFHSDTEREIDSVIEQADRLGAFGVGVMDAYGGGGAGAEEVARMVIKAAETPSQLNYLYQLDQPIHAKIERIATSCYGAAGVSYSNEARWKVEKFTEWGFAGLPICMAKTHLSLSHNPTLKGKPSGFIIPVHDVRLSAGAGFIYPLLGEINLMPGLPSSPNAEAIDLDEDGNIVGM
jgi:formyltetrahydrofolate synthetase